MLDIIKKRTRAIRQTTPNCIEQLFEMQNRICDLCQKPIQDLVLAHLDHSTPVIDYAQNLEMSLVDAIEECNSLKNLRVVHATCNLSKNDLTRDEWFTRGLDKVVGIHKVYTPEELSRFKNGNQAGGKTQGTLNVESGHLERARSKLTVKQRIAIGKKIGKNSKENRLGIFSPDYTRPESLRFISKALGLRTKELGIGIFGLTFEQRSLQSKKTGLIGRHNRWKHKGDFSNCSRCHKTEEQRKVDHLESSRRSHKKKVNLKTAVQIEEIFQRNGSVQGHRNVASGVLKKAAHFRWHVNRGILKLSCSFCKLNV